LYFKRKGAPFYSCLVPIAQKRLMSIELLLSPPVVVFGDASYSMDVAIRTATIISSVLTVLSGAELKFFNVTSVDPTRYPTNVVDLIEVAETMKADGLTAPAAALYPYYLAKKPVKFIVVVTDEIENNKFSNQWYFPDLFLRYYQEVYPSKLIFVSFLEDPSVVSGGRMVNSLKNLGIEILQFRLDGNRPDLTKLDTLLGLLSSESAFFPKQVASLAELYSRSGLKDLISRLENPPERVHPKAEDADPKGKDKQKIVDNEIPAHFCCPVSLSIMEEPVITPAGHSYERETIIEVIARTGRDPLTQEPLTIEDLRPNRGLKEAIQAYLADKV